MMSRAPTGLWEYGDKCAGSELAEIDCWSGGEGEEPYSLFRNHSGCVHFWESCLSGYCAGGPNKSICRAAEKPPKKGEEKGKVHPVPTPENEKSQT